MKPDFTLRRVKTQQVFESRYSRASALACRENGCDALRTGGETRGGHFDALSAAPVRLHDP